MTEETQTKKLSNAWLTAIVLFIALIFLSVIWRSMVLNNPSGQWTKEQEKNLQAALSGQTNLVSNKFDPKDLIGKHIKLPILMYHHIGEVPKDAEFDELRKGLTVSPKNFEEQVAWVKTHGYNSITLQNLLDFVKGGFSMPQNPIIFTFDDGYDDALENAPAILKKSGYVGSFAVITQFPGTHYGTNRYATWQEIKQAKNAGMEIVSHTQDHFDGTSKVYDDAFILRNLTNSRQDIKDNLNLDTKILIYPFGHYDSRYIKLAQKAGFEMGVAIHDHNKVPLDKMFEIPRLRINGGTTLEGFKRLLLD